MNDIDTLLALIIGLAAACVFFLMLIGLVQGYGRFTRELRRLNNEIGRTQGFERRRWLRRRRRLWLSLIPFVKY